MILIEIQFKSRDFEIFNNLNSNLMKKSINLSKKRNFADSTQESYSAEKPKRQRFADTVRDQIQVQGAYTDSGLQNKPEASQDEDESARQLRIQEAT
jgi:hypothetical protein